MAVARRCFPEDFTVSSATWRLGSHGRPGRLLPSASYLHTRLNLLALQGPLPYVEGSPGYRGDHVRLCDSVDAVGKDGIHLWHQDWLWL